VPTPLVGVRDKIWKRFPVCGLRTGGSWDFLRGRRRLRDCAIVEVAISVAMMALDNIVLVVLLSNRGSLSVYISSAAQLATDHHVIHSTGSKPTEFCSYEYC
jgi:hypothetical protein